MILDDAKPVDAGGAPGHAPGHSPGHSLEARLQLTVATYNIHRAVGGDRRRDPGRIADTIVALGADVIALQEVETPLRPDPLTLLRRLHACGYAEVLGHTMRRGPDHYGNLLLTRLPLRTYCLIDLSQPGCEPRGLIDARLTLGSGRDAPVLRCLATHLGLRGWERRRQLARISAAIADAPVPQRALTVLLGDCNEWRVAPERLAPLARLLTPAPTRASFPSTWPLFALDRIWHGSGLELARIEVVRDARTRAASDHLPVRAVLLAI